MGGEGACERGGRWEGGRLGAGAAEGGPLPPSLAGQLRCPLRRLQAQGFSSPRPAGPFLPTRPADALRVLMRPCRLTAGSGARTYQPGRQGLRGGGRSAGDPAEGLASRSPVLTGQWL